MFSSCSPGSGLAAEPPGRTGVPHHGVVGVPARVESSGTFKCPHSIFSFGLVPVYWENFFPTEPNVEGGREAVGRGSSLLARNDLGMGC